MSSAVRRWTTPRGAENGVRRIANLAGLSVAILPNGCVFAIEHDDGKGAVAVNQIYGSPLDGGMGRILLRLGGGQIVEAVGPGAVGSCAVGESSCVWEGHTSGLRHTVTLALHPTRAAWRWAIEVENESAETVPLDAVLVQDLGLGSRGFLTNNEAYASQYIDHRPTPHPGLLWVLMSRQALKQNEGNPWVAHWCEEGTAGFATDAIDVFGPAYRDASDLALPFGTDLPSRRRQYETACVALQTRPAEIAPGETGRWHFSALFVADHAMASGDADLALVESVNWTAPPHSDHPPPPPASEERGMVRSLIQHAPPLVVEPLADIASRYPVRTHEEIRKDTLLSFFADGRHIVLAEKERLIARRHGTLLRSGTALLPDETTLCSTAWMHGIFAAQLTIGNTSFHKLFSVSREPWGATRSSGLRILAETSDGWRLLTVPSAFEIGLSDCRWIYRTASRIITVRAVASGSDPALLVRVTVEGEPCRFLVFGHVVLGERELDHAGIIEIDAKARRFAFRPDPGFLWGQRYPDAVYHLTAATPVEAMGGDELLYDDGECRGGAYVAFRSVPASELVFAITGSLADPAEADRLASRYAGGVDDAALLKPAESFWNGLTGGRRFTEPSFDTLLPWLAHDAIIHLTVPHGLEQYTGGAWGTRDVCQGPIEFLLALGRKEAVRAILETLFAQQYAERGDWPQWFMLEPYSVIQDRTSHGDVIVWPLKALADYIEATDDLGILDAQIAWRDLDTLERTSRTDSVTAHIETLIAAAVSRFVPGTHLIRLGEGDWNDSLQPADPSLRDRMVSAWTVALFYQQLRRWAAILRHRGGDGGAIDRLADAMAGDFRRLLMRDGAVAGYALFDESGGMPELLLHPSDSRTGLHYSLLPITQAILGGLFTPDEAASHADLVRAHLTDPDGARLIDRPPTYHGGIETVFRRAESAANVGREIGLMYVHSNLRWAEALALLGDHDACRDAVLAVDPIAVTERLAHAALRQRNTYFSSSDAAFPDRYAAQEEWSRVHDGSIPVEGGWRTYSSGPGLFTNLLVRQFLSNAPPSLRKGERRKNH